MQRLRLLQSVLSTGQGRGFGELLFTRGRAAPESAKT